MSAKHSGYPRRRRTAAERRADRAAGVDRFGKPLPRTAGTNPRALGTNPRAIQAQREAVGRTEFVPASERESGEHGGPRA